MTKFNTLEDLTEAVNHRGILISPDELEAAVARANQIDPIAARASTEVSFWEGLAAGQRLALE